jgi:hypothetical protein
MAESLLQMDYARAILATAEASAALFAPAVEESDGALRAEIGRWAHTKTQGRNRLLIRPLLEQPVEGQAFEGSNLSDFPFQLIFQIKDVQDKGAALVVAGSVLQALFGDQGAGLWANFTDTGSNLIGSPGLLTVGPPEEVPVEGAPDYFAVTALLTIRAMAKVPRVHTV